MWEPTFSWSGSNGLVLAFDWLQRKLVFGVPGGLHNSNSDDPVGNIVRYSTPSTSTKATEISKKAKTTILNL